MILLSTRERVEMISRKKMAPGIRISIRIPGDVVYVWILGVSYVYQVLIFFRQIVFSVKLLIFFVKLDYTRILYFTKRLGNYEILSLVGVKITFPCGLRPLGKVIFLPPTRESISYLPAPLVKYNIYHLRFCSNIPIL